MAKKKRASAPDSSSTGLKPSTSKVNTRDAAAEKPKSDLEPKLTLESSPRHPNTPPQRQKNSIASLLNDESTPKRRISARLNPDCAISYQNEDNYQPTVANGAEEQAVLTASQVKKPALRSITPELFAQAEAKKEEGNVHFKSAKFTDAIKCYSEAIALNCDNPAYLSNRAAASMALGDYRSALNDMQTVTSSKFLNLGIQPSIKNLLRLIRCLLPLGKFYAARQTLNQISKLYPDSHELKKEESRLINLEFRLNSLQQNRLDEKWNLLLLGLVALERELDCGPLKVKDWLIWRVEGLCGQKKWEDANSLCSDLVRSYPSDPEVLYHRAKVMYSQGNLTATIRHCQEAMRCDPDFTGARNLLRRAKNIESLKESGNTSFKASDFKTAIAKYLEASSIDPTNKAVVTTLDSNRAQALFKSKNNQEAIKICNKILEVDAHHFKALRTRGRAKKAESDFDGAILDFEIASKFAPSAKEGAEISSDIKATKILVSRGKYVDYYKVLEVSRNATDDEIKKGFRKKSLIHHPDKGGNEEKFKEVNEAYRVLQDPQSRRKFDLTDPDNPEGTLNNGRGAGFSNAEYAFSFDDLFTTVGGSTSSYKRTPFGRHAHAHHGYQSSSSFFPNSNAF